MKLQFAVDHEYKGQKVGAGKTLQVDPSDARVLIHYGVARAAPETTEAPKASEKKGA